MKIICKISDEEPIQWFFSVLSQAELDSVVGIKVCLLLNLYKIFIYISLTANKDIIISSYLQSFPVRHTF